MLCALRWWVLALMLVAELPRVAALAQEIEEDDTVLRVVTLDLLPVDEAVSLIDELFPGHLDGRVGSASTSRIVLRGDKETVAEVEDMLRKVDAGETGARPQELGTEFIAVQTYPMEHILGLLQALELDRRYVRTAVDQFNRQLVLTAPAHDVRMVKELIAQVDRPQRSLALHFFFLRGKMGATFDARTGKLPPHLTAVGTALGENGFGDPSLIGAATIRASSGELFETYWTQSAGAEGMEGDLSFSLRGNAESQRNADAVEIEIETDLNVRGGQGQLRETPFTLQTTLSARLEQYVVVAAAPSTTEDGTAIALAVRVTRD